ncbi:hypothetical protein BS17DRAFT_770188 [Gyrodon lividus]|nr:hypothetical protein BS17DRAFT_770188 [Gyrodon lividus]
MTQNASKQSAHNTSITINSDSDSDHTDDEGGPTGYDMRNQGNVDASHTNSCAASALADMLHPCSHAASDNGSMLHLHSHEGPDDGGVLHPQAHASLVLALPQINAQQYPVWAFLARDYLSIMASSVSSDIVAAIKVLCMLYNQDLMFCEPPPSSALQLDMKKENNTFATESTNAEDLSWILELSDDSDVKA